jgi:hypothetical protein
MTQSGLSDSPAAKRMRRHRQRRRYGIRPVQIGIDPVVIEALVKVRYLKAIESGNSDAIAQAVIDFMTDKLILFPMS